MLLKKKIFLLAIAFASIALTGCGNGAMTLSPNRPNQATSASRVFTPQGTANTAGFGAGIALTYYAGTSNNNLLSGVTASVSQTNSAQLQIYAPNVGVGTSICVITGVQYASDPCGTGSYFTDIGEERCGMTSSGKVTITMARSDFNIVTVVLNSDLAQFNSYINGNSTSYPSLAQGQIASDMPYPSGVCGN